MMRFLRGRCTRALAATAALFTVAAGATFAAAPAADAANCKQSQAPTVNGEGSALVTANRNLKVGPYGDCANIGAIRSETLVYYRCYYDNSLKHRWWYVRPQGSSVPGWLSGDDLFHLYLDDNHDGHEDLLPCYIVGH